MSNDIIEVMARAAWVKSASGRELPSWDSLLEGSRYQLAEEMRAALLALAEQPITDEMYKAGREAWWATGGSAREVHRAMILAIVKEPRE